MGLLQTFKEKSKNFADSSTQCNTLDVPPKIELKSCGVQTEFLETIETTRTPAVEDDVTGESPLETKMLELLTLVQKASKDLQKE